MKQVSEETTPAEFDARTATDRPADRDDLRRKVTAGLRTLHLRANAHIAKTLETASFLYALIDLLSERGLISIEDLDARKVSMMERQRQRYTKDGMGVVMQDGGFDKYSFERTAEIDCASRVHLCKASCCRLPFALSRQDLEERVVRWNFELPYMIDQDEDGYCVHHDRCSGGCTIYAQRPVPCRGYDCRNDQRIWLDFENRIPNPAVERADWLEMEGSDAPGEAAGSAGATSAPR